MTTYAVAFAEQLQLESPQDFVRGLKLEGEIYASLGSLLENYDVLICPTQAVPALKADDDYVGHGPTVNGKELANVWDAVMTLPFNIASQCPVLSVPSGFAANGVPTGLQIVGRTYDDTTVFAAAAAFEAERPWLDEPARRPFREIALS
jgi:aspartyl-tRNA(Asn)/glutamyl-tRNA(Gln) amidotransferase subunit A